MAGGRDALHVVHGGGGATGVDAWCLEIERPDTAGGQNRGTGRK